MRIYTKAGDLPFELFDFPDGQPHFKLLHRDEWREATIEMAITTPKDLFLTQIVSAVLMQVGYKVNLDIRYLMGARMDRAINAFQPFTLGVVASILNIGFQRIRILDAHSPVATSMIFKAENILPFSIVKSILLDYSVENTVVIIPDRGATDRVNHLLPGISWHTRQGHKLRDVNTGNLTGFDVTDKSFVKGKKCLIIDDICDGGGTFSGLAEVLLDAGATQVDLYVTHGIFSKGLPLKGIKKIYTTDSFPKSDVGIDNNVVVFPISMKDIK